MPSDIVNTINMEDIIQNIVETRLGIAQTEEQSLQRTKHIKDLSEKIAGSDTKILDLNREIQSLLKSITNLIAEKESYRSALEQNKENSKECRSPDQFLKIPTEIDGIEKWMSILAESDCSDFFKRLKVLSQRGIPTKVRGELWSRVIGNDLFITSKLFSSLLNSAKKSGKSEQEENGTLLIPMDLRRTLSNLQVFQEKQPLHSALSEILQAFAVRFI